ncbi:MAG: aminotransferase class I/II-fold pyridoxal phosphate-dependent enzyme [Chloroflexi bacterium]|nr:aminotransferase class I/II-fold pyridoxal phosphate-dependent enzyme [Chloroflexota bacterium]
MNRTIDLRSDTVTLPSAEMRAAMAAADLGDDVYGEDPSVSALEARAAEMLGKEAGLFVPSGTMGNLIAVMTHTRPGDEIICGRLTHTYVAEGAGAARIAGVSVWPVSHEQAQLDPVEVESGFHPTDDPHYPRTSLVIVEQPNRGWVMPLDNLSDIACIARRHGVPVHMDGARIFNAAVALGVPAREIAAHADSLMFCVSKGLAAPVGSVLVGSAAFVAQARRARKVLGGGMRQAGVLAAGGLYALDHMVDRVAEDHALAQRLATGLRELGWWIDREVVQTNVFFTQPPQGLDLAAVVAGLARTGVQVASPYSGRTLRLVTHYGLEPEDMEEALLAFGAITPATRGSAA